MGEIKRELAGQLELIQHIKAVTSQVHHEHHGLKAVISARASAEKMRLESPFLNFFEDKSVKSAK